LKAYAEVQPGRVYNGGIAAGAMRWDRLMVDAPGLANRAPVPVTLTLALDGTIRTSGSGGTGGATTPSGYATLTVQHWRLTYILGDGGSSWFLPNGEVSHFNKDVNVNRSFSLDFPNRVPLEWYFELIVRAGASFGHQSISDFSGTGRTYFTPGIPGAVITSESGSSYSPVPEPSTPLLVGLGLVAVRLFGARSLLKNRR
jgi:hypothetical protein